MKESNTWIFCNNQTSLGVGDTKQKIRIKERRQKFCNWKSLNTDSATKLQPRDVGGERVRFTFRKLN